MAIKRCDTCNGRKRVTGMGGMEKECKPCKGVGWIEDEAPVTKSEEKRIQAQEVKTVNLKNVSGQPVVAKKRGRRPRIKTE